MVTATLSSKWGMWISGGEVFCSGQSWEVVNQPWKPEPLPFLSSTVSQMRQASHRASHRAFLPSLGAILWPSGTYWEMDSWDPLLRLTHPRSHQLWWDELKTHCLPLWGRQSGGSYPEAHQTLVLLLSIAQTQNLLARGPYNGKLTGIKCSPWPISKPPPPISLFSSENLGFSVMHISMHFSTLKTMHNESAHSQPWGEAESPRVHRTHPGPQEMFSAKDMQTSMNLGGAIYNTPSWDIPTACQHFKGPISLVRKRSTLFCLIHHFSGCLFVCLFIFTTTSFTIKVIQQT